jgi:hypothetical protein
VAWRRIYQPFHRDWEAVQRHFDIALGHTQQPGYPVLEPKIAIKSFREGLLLEGHFLRKRVDFEARMAYDNHLLLAANLEATREKFGQEEAKSFHIPFPRFVAQILSVAMILPISWVVQKDP